MGAFKRVILAVDGSENSKRAVEMVKKLAGNGSLHVAVVHVVQPVYQTVGAYGYFEIPSLLEVQEETGRKILADTYAELAETGAEVETHLVIGRIGEEICELAREGGYDLIVVGRRGISRLGEVVLGSVSEYVIRHSHLPVLVVQ